MLTVSLATITTETESAKRMIAQHAAAESLTSVKKIQMENKDINHFSLQYLPSTLIVDEQHAIKTPIQLSNLLRQFFAELSGLHLLINNGWKGDRQQSQSHTKVLKYLRSVSPINWINDQIRECVYEPFRARQLILFTLFPIMPQLWAALSDTDKKIFLRDWHSIFISFAAAFPLKNAYKIKSMLKTGQLNVMRSLEFIQPYDNQEGRVYRLSGQQYSSSFKNTRSLFYR